MDCRGLKSARKKYKELPERRPEGRLYPFVGAKDGGRSQPTVSDVIERRTPLLHRTLAVFLQPVHFFADLDLAVPRILAEIVPFVGKDQQ